jgi:hypothetical protein
LNPFGVEEFEEAVGRWLLALCTMSCFWRLASGGWLLASDTAALPFDTSTLRHFDRLSGTRLSGTRLRDRDIEREKVRE